NLASRVKKSSNRQLTWDFDLNAQSPSTNVMGGGIVFKLDLDNVGSELGEPELLSGNRGWTWGRPGATRFEMRFDPPLASVYFERGRKSEIRAFFYQGEISQGQQHYIANLNISDDAVINPTTAERFGLDDYLKWPRDIFDTNRAPIDLSFLNDAEKPAGKHGF